MVRAVMRCVCLALALGLSLPHVSLAEDGDEGGGTSVDYNWNQRFDDISGQLNSVSTDVGGLSQTLDGHLTNIEQLLAPEPEVEVEGAKDELDYLISIDDKLSEITLRETAEDAEVQAVGGTRATTYTFGAYTNTPPTGTYATYALGFLPRVGFGEHYVYLQDTQSSYVFVWGDMNATSSSQVTGDAKWVRWYNAGTQYGYVQESGTGSVTVNTNNHVIISDLQGWPMLTGANTELVRREVGFYAQVAVVIFVLAGVWSFTLRYRTSSTPS